MKHPFFPFLFLAAVIGAASGGLAGFFLSTPPTPARGQEIASLPPAQAEPDADVLAHLHQLRVENEDLRERIAALEERPLEVREPVAVTVIPAFEEEVRTWMDSVGEKGTAAPDLVFSVEKALGVIREREQLEEEIAQEQRRAERTEQKLQKLATRLDLDQHQIGEMRTLWAMQEDSEKRLKEVRMEGDREASREFKRSMREEYRAGLSRILTPDQLESFRAREERREREKDRPAPDRDSPRRRDSDKKRRDRQI